MKSFLLVTLVQSVAIAVAALLVSLGLFGAERSTAGFLPMALLYTYYGLPYIITNSIILTMVVDWRLDGKA